MRTRKITRLRSSTAQKIQEATDSLHQPPTSPKKKTLQSTLSRPKTVSKIRRMAILLQSLTSAINKSGKGKSSPEKKTIKNETNNSKQKTTSVGCKKQIAGNSSYNCFPLELSRIRNKDLATEATNYLFNSELPEEVAAKFLDSAKNINISRALNQSLTTESHNNQSSEKKEEIPKIDEIASNCLHINISYFIWSRGENSDRDPVEIAHSYRHTILQNNKSK